MGFGGNRVTLASFMRSGNTFLKRFLERITGITTGSEFKFDTLLQMVGLLGEGHCSTDRVWITKSHAPVSFKVLKSDWYTQ